MRATRRTIKTAPRKTLGNVAYMSINRRDPAGKLYACGGYGEERAGLICIDTQTWECRRVPTTGPAPKSHDSHSMTAHGAQLKLQVLLGLQVC